LTKSEILAIRILIGGIDPRPAGGRVGEAAGCLKRSRPQLPREFEPEAVFLFESAVTH
jgi:hypothetical protein